MSRPCPSARVDLAAIEEASVELVNVMEAVHTSPDDERWAALLWWVRSPYWHPALMLCTGWQGQVARAAYRALRAELNNDTPARRWDRADHAIGRASINRLLGLSDDPSAAFASAAFRTIVDDDGRAWIGGAIGCQPVLSVGGLLRWTHLDIRDVIHFDPRNGEVHVAGDEYGGAQVILPDILEDPLVAYGDTLSFFRTWAERRARLGDNARHSRIGEWAHPVVDPHDSCLPGALVVGDIREVRWPDVPVSTVIAGPGLNRNDLYSAALRSAGLPSFRGGDSARG